MVRYMGRGIAMDYEFAMDYALRWVASYLSNRCQLISIQGKFSIPMSLIYGVPQGSVLGPLLFILNTTPLSQIITKFEDFQHHLKSYADHTQIFTSVQHIQSLLWILTMLNVSGFVSCFWVRVHQIGYMK